MKPRLELAVRAIPMVILGEHPLKTTRGSGYVHAFRYANGRKVCVAMRYPSSGGGDGELLRVQLGCLYATVFASTDCDCGEQIRVALDEIAHHGGIFLYFPDEEGRGHGFDDKIRELSESLQHGGDADDTTQHIVSADLSCLDVVPFVLQELGITSSMDVMTNSRRKYDALLALGVASNHIVPLHIRLSTLSPFARRERREKRLAERSGAVRFYDPDGLFGWLANYSPHSIVLDGETWPSVEHCYQAGKFKNSAIRRQIRLAATPAAAKAIAQRHRSERRPDWKEVKDGTMKRAVRAKFEQHPELGAQLLALGSRRIVEESHVDAYWGSGADGHGENRLGKILMALRAELAPYKH